MAHWLWGDHPSDVCVHCGAKAINYYCDPCNTDSCLVADENGDTYCGRAPREDEE